MLNKYSDSDSDSIVHMLYAMRQQTLPCPPPPELPRVGSFFLYRCLVFPKKCPQRKA